MNREEYKGIKLPVLNARQVTLMERAISKILIDTGFDSLEKIALASQEDLETVKGIPDWIARCLVEGSPK